MFSYAASLRAASKCLNDLQQTVCHYFDWCHLRMDQQERSISYWLKGANSANNGKGPACRVIIFWKPVESPWLLSTRYLTRDVSWTSGPQKIFWHTLVLSALSLLCMQQKSLWGTLGSREWDVMVQIKSGTCSFPSLPYHTLWTIFISSIKNLRSCSRQYATIFVGEIAYRRSILAVIWRVGMYNSQWIN